MCPARIEAIEVDHIVEFTKDSTIFAAARGDNGHLYLFLIHEDTGNVYSRNGQADSWEELKENEKGAVIARVTAARKNTRTPVYRINGTNGSI
jgi:hypothetical protein